MTQASQIFSNADLCDIETACGAGGFAEERDGALHVLFADGSRIVFDRDETFTIELVCESCGTTDDVRDDVDALPGVEVCGDCANDILWPA